MKLQGLTFSVAEDRDDFINEPWKEFDFYGVVSEWTTRDKRPGERILVADRDFKRYYDVQATLERARREGWGVPNPTGKTKGQIAAEAVERDFQRLKAWCNDEWHYVCVTVTLLDVNGNKTMEREALGGVESDEHIDEVATDLARRIADRIGSATVVCQTVRSADQGSPEQQLELPLGHGARDLWIGAEDSA